MRIIADLHVHSGYSRATSKDMNLASMARWAALKGINVVGTGDFTHPAHFKAIKERLEPAESGLFKLKETRPGKNNVRFMLTAEVSNIFTQSGKTRKIHNLIFAPTVAAAERMNARFAGLGNIASDGRPIFGFSALDLLKIVMEADPSSMLVPAHAWTPWFSIFGSRSGFDSIEECFGDASRHIRAIETGLSSNPAMNRRLSMLDDVALISNSDAHSPSKLGREANVLDTEMNYEAITGAIKDRDKKRFLYTVEFFPEEGKYHSDGHRECGVMLTPEETKKNNGVCPVCGKGVTVGVLSRVEELADRPDGFILKDAVPGVSLMPLQEILSEVFECGVNTQKVQREYIRLTTTVASEFVLLLDMSGKDLVKATGEKTALAIAKVRKGEIRIRPGFDGEFGKIRIFGDIEKPGPSGHKQALLF